eukprot:8985471-Pyramimonas_sp.AAC.2
MERYRPDSSQPTIPPWIAGLPEFSEALQELTSEIPESWEVWGEVGDHERTGLYRRPSRSRCCFPPPRPNAAGAALLGSDGTESADLW